MEARWYYTHEGQVQGPVSGTKLHELAALGQLVPGDLVWLEGGSRDGAVSAETILDLHSAASPPPASPPDVQVTPAAEQTSSPPRPVSSSADWLHDVRQAELSQPAPPPAPRSVAANWLEDVRQAEQPASAHPPTRPEESADHGRKKVRPPPPPAPPVPSATGWLEDVSRAERKAAPLVVSEPVLPTEPIEDAAPGPLAASQPARTGPRLALPRSPESILILGFLVLGFFVLAVLAFLVVWFLLDS